MDLIAPEGNIEFSVHTGKYSFSQHLLGKINIPLVPQDLWMNIPMIVSFHSLEDGNTASFSQENFLQTILQHRFSLPSS